MRPVEKCHPGQVIRLDDGSCHRIREDYERYQDAKTPLTANLGAWCSYCEIPFHEPRACHVEHVQPKGFRDSQGKLTYESLENKWSNFLLSCNTCNGQDNKGTKNVVLQDVHLPHINNTFLSLQYNPGGVVTVNPSLHGPSAKHAKALLELVGLDKTPAECGGTDVRWKRRLEAWNYAQKKLIDYRAGKWDINDLIEYVKAKGNWSIWFTVFAEEDAVRQRLIGDFSGTCAQCFDATNHYAPVPRNPDNPADPV